MQVNDADARAVSQVTCLQMIGGFPKSDLDQYVGHLVRAGHSIAITMQGEDKISSWVASKQNLNGCQLERLQYESRIPAALRVMMPAHNLHKDRN